MESLLEPQVAGSFFWRLSRTFRRWTARVSWVEVAQRLRLPFASALQSAKVVRRDRVKSEMVRVSLEPMARGRRAWTVKDVSAAKVVRAKVPVVSCRAQAAESGMRKASVVQCPFTTLVEDWGAVTSFWHERRVIRTRKAVARDAR